MAATENNINTNNMSEPYFEGVEKLLEVWFTNGDSARQGDLRKIPRQKWENLLKIVRCEIISFISNDQIDAYILSESSMFVSRRRLILKTCGTTTPLLCLDSLLRLVDQLAGFSTVQELFYSHKNYGRPELQHRPHKAFCQEVDLLNTFFDSGASYCLGNEEAGECWYLYTLRPAISAPGILNFPVSLGLNSANNKQLLQISSRAKTEPDQTLEILMTNLDPDIMSIFTREESQTAAEATQKSGIDKLIPSMTIDDFLFEPCGYSMNGITKAGYYMTIHITPEPDFSYVSFETNFPAVSYRDLVQRVLDTFRPNDAVVTIFANKSSVAADAPREMDDHSALGELLQRDIQHCRFKHYDLTYTFYSKFPS